MKNFKYLLALAGITTVLATVTTQTQAQDNTTPPQRGQGQGQGRGNFDPAQMQQRMMEYYREQMEVKSDDEWKIIETRIEKVNEARRQVGGGIGGFGGFGRGGRPPGGGDNAQAGNDQGGRRGRGGFGGEPNPQVEALRKGIESKASAEELKSLMAKVREARKENEAKLEKAQDELRKVLSVRQEAVAMANGLLR